MISQESRSGSSPLRAVGESHRIPSLDGLRALSIVGVLAGHLALSARTLIPSHLKESTEVASHMGVQLFFVISGFLITGLLRQEFERYGSISLPRFYFRRALRIFPAYYAMLLVVSVLGKGGYIPVPSGDLIRAGTYTFNYLLQSASAYDHEALAHTWSLAVEEQFYLIWPAMVCFLGWRWSTRGAAGLIAGLAIIRFGFSHFVVRHNAPPDWPAAGFDLIAWGCLLACNRSRLEALGWYRRLLRATWSHIVWAVPVISLILSGGHIFFYRIPVHYWTNPTLIGAGLTFLVHRCVAVPSGLLGRFLNLRMVATFGVLSYSLYLWHPLFIDGNLNTLVNHFPWNLAAALTAAVLSYRFIEKPFLKLRGKLEPKLFGSRRNLSESEIARAASV